VTPARDPQPRQVRYSARWQARLDGGTGAKLDDLASTFRRKRGAILRFVMHWGLAHTTRWTIEPSIPDRPHLVHMLTELEFLRQVQDAADRHGETVAVWLRHALRQVTPDEFPPSWRVGDTTIPSHDSGYDHRKFQLRLDEETSRTLARLTHTFGRSAAEVIRQLVAQANPEDFPQSWQLAVEERRQRRSPSGRGSS
jgi:predicted transcriptional regulator